MQIDVIGSLRVRNPDPVRMSRPSHRRLLAILVHHGETAIETDILIDRFWAGSPPRTARAAIQTHISGLRGLLGKTAIAFDGTGYFLQIETSGVDVHVFEALWTAARTLAEQGSWQRVLDTVGEAGPLWRGQPYGDLRDDWFSLADIARLNEMRLGLAELKGEALLQQDRQADAVPALEFMVIEEPDRERLWELLMMAQYRLGRHADAVRTFAEASDHFATMGLEPSGRLRRLEEQILLHDRALTPTPHNLAPDLDRFIGRTSEISEVRELLVHRRLVTLTGPGGVGKTRLAERVSKGLFDRFGGGIWIVRLDSIDDAHFVHTSIATTIGLKPQDAEVTPVLVEGLSGQPSLVILDNCEHLLPAMGPVVEALLHDIPNVTILTTSREPLRVPGEAVVEIRGLGVTIDAGNDATTLFADRARVAVPQFILEGETKEFVARICDRLDGLPLAIELAAARVPSLGVSTIADRLDEQLRFLTAGASTAPDRHRTLRASIEWSYRLLAADERVALMRLSVFRSGFSLEAAEHVLEGVSGAGAVVDIVPNLVDKSLVTATSHGSSIRYRMLEAVRQFAWSELADRGHLGDARQSHALWAVTVADHLWPSAVGAGTIALSTVLADEADNLQAALSWSVDHEPELGGALSEALAWHWYFTGHLTRAFDCVGFALGSELDDRRRTLLLAHGAQILAFSEDIDRAIELVEQAKVHMQHVASPTERAWILSVQQLCYFMSVHSDPSLMLEVADEALTLSRGSSDSPTRALALEVAADGYCWNGRTKKGLSFQEEALDIARTSGDRGLIDRAYGHAIYNLMLDPASRGTRPGTHMDEWMAIVPQGKSSGFSTATDWLPWIHMQRGDLDAASRTLTRMGERTREAYNRTIYHIVKATVAWMRGDLKVAAHEIALLEELGVNERWWHVFYPLAAEIATDRGAFEDTRRIAETYLGLDVHTTGEAAKLGVLMPLVRAEVDTGITSDREDAVIRVNSVLGDMSGILREHPPLIGAWTSLMTHGQNLIFSQAELTRLTTPDPDVWMHARHSADYAYYRTYATWRMSEALITLGRHREATPPIMQAIEEAIRMRAGSLGRRISNTAHVAGIDLSR